MMKSSSDNYKYLYPCTLYFINSILCVIKKVKQKIKETKDLLMSIFHLI